MRVITRKEAKALGLKRYFTGKPCKHNHLSEKQVRNGECMKCAGLRARNNYQEDPEEHASKARKYYRKNKQKCIARSVAYAKNHREQINKQSRECKRQWDRRNQRARTATEAKRRATKLNATPKWADLSAIKEFYLNCPPGFHVDHIIPLRGKTVTGLHVLGNLQYLPALDNIRKSNKFI